jgi:signal transduction histidine kinase
LTSILGFTEILLDQEKLTEVQRRFCQKIQNSGVQLLTSLNQLVDLSRLEAGPAELFFQEFSLRDALRETCSAVARFAQKQDLNLEYDLAPEITTIVSDRGRLRQILYTFLAWAISRSKEGQTVTVYADLLEGPMLRVKIEDEGEHVTNVRCVFDPEEGSPGREASVNELGIIIGRRLLALLRGTVTLENRGTGGLRIIIELPAGPPKG